MTLLLMALNVCHFLADYTHLSTSWMLNAKRFGKPLFPILCHACCHGTLMYFTLLLFIDNTMAVTLCLFQVITHFLIDVLKGKTNVWFPTVSSPVNKSHWYLFGADQLLHQLIIIIMAYVAI